DEVFGIERGDHLASDLGGGRAAIDFERLGDLLGVDVVEAERDVIVAAALDEQDARRAGELGEGACALEANLAGGRGGGGVDEAGGLVEIAFGIEAGLGAV